jgi:hypothetical protein
MESLQTVTKSQKHFIINSLWLLSANILFHKSAKTNLLNHKYSYEKTMAFGDHRLNYFQ